MKEYSAYDDFLIQYGYYDDFLKKHGYREVDRNTDVLYVKESDNKYTLLIFENNIFLYYNKGGLAYNDGSGGIYYRYNVPADILLKIACEESSEIHKKLYEYDLNRNLEVLG